MSNVVEKYFVANTEGVNSKGYRVLTSGIRTERFEKNPICLGEHYSVVGKWQDWKKEGGQLQVGRLQCSRREYAQAYKADVEDGILSAVSIGVRPITWSEDVSLMLPGQTRPTLVECELVEVSLVAVPANPDAVGVRLYAEGDKLEHMSAEQLEQIFIMSMKQETKTVPGETPKVEQEMERLSALEQGFMKQAEQLERIENALNTLNKAFLQNKETPVSQAAGASPETEAGADETSVVQTLKQKVEQLERERVSVAELLGAFKGGVEQAEDRKKWSLSDWQRKDPEGLGRLRESTPEVFAALVNASKV